MSKASRAVATRRVVIGFSGGKFGMHAAEQAKLLPNRSYFYGASSAPKIVFVVRFDDEYVYFHYESELREFGRDALLRREQRWIFCDLAHRGTKTAREQARSAFASTANPFYAKQIAELTAKLAGDVERAPEESVDRFVGEVIYLVSSAQPGDKDPRYAAEEYGGVGRRKLDDGRYVYRVDTTAELAQKAKADPRFVVVDGE